jgi:hypothetical protein
MLAFSARSPAKAGVHSSTVSAAEKWAPAFAGEPKGECAG